MFSLTNKKKLSLNYPQYPLLSGALLFSREALLCENAQTMETLHFAEFGFGHFKSISAKMC